MLSCVASRPPAPALRWPRPCGRARRPGSSKRSNARLAPARGSPFSRPGPCPRRSGCGCAVAIAMRGSRPSRSRPLGPRSSSGAPPLPPSSCAGRATPEGCPASSRASSPFKKRARRPSPSLSAPCPASGCLMPALAVATRPSRSPTPSGQGGASTPPISFRRSSSVCAKRPLPRGSSSAISTPSTGRQAAARCPRALTIVCSSTPLVRVWAPFAAGPRSPAAAPPKTSPASPACSPRSCAASPPRYAPAARSSTPSAACSPTSSRACSTRASRAFAWSRPGASCPSARAPTATRSPRWCARRYFRNRSRAMCSANTSAPPPSSP